MTILTNVEQMKQLDPGGMLDRIGEFPQQVRDAWSNVSSWENAPDIGDGVNQIVVLGMGGSAIGADLVVGLLADMLPVPLIVHRGYGLPRWVDADTLVIASSHSGGTEETLSGWRAAGERGAPRLAVTTGGKLAAMAREAGVPILTFHYDSQPRAALGHSFTLLLGVLWKLGLIDDPAREVEGAVVLLEEAQQAWQPDVPVEHNWPKQIAAWWHGHLPIIFGAEHLSVIARRWTTQINENSKSWALWAEMPELNHNIVVGFSRPPRIRDGARILCLRSRHYHERNQARFDITRELLEQEGLVATDIRAEGDTLLSELLWSNLLGDYASYYLAMLYGVDPTPVEPIARLKEKLATLEG